VLVPSPRRMGVAVAVAATEFPFSDRVPIAQALEHPCIILMARCLTAQL
jgi:hypothetical protein